MSKKVDFQGMWGEAQSEIARLNVLIADTFWLMIRNRGALDETRVLNHVQTRLGEQVRKRQDELVSWKAPNDTHKPE